MKPNEEPVLYSVHDKTIRLKSLESPRLILMGGSSVSCSLDSKTLQDSLGINIQNYGLIGNIGLRFTLDNITDELHSGDILVIPIEWEQFYGRYSSRDGASFAQAYFYSPNKNWNKLNFSQLKNLIVSVPDYIWTNTVFKKGDKFVYSAKNFNEFGDEIAHLIEKPKYKHTPADRITEKFDKYAVNDFARKIKALQKKGIKVYLMGHITTESYYQENKEAGLRIVEELNKKGITFKTSPDYFVVPDSMAFDLASHLNKLGVDEITQRMINTCQNLGFLHIRY